MAESTNFIDNNISAVGRQNPDIFTNALQSAPTIKNDYLRVITNVKNDSVIVNKLGIPTSISQADGRNCAWNPSDGAALDSKEIDLAPMKVNIEICNDELDSLFSQAQYDATRLGLMPASFQEVLMARLEKSLGLDIEYLVWSANSSDADTVDGLIVKAAADEDVIAVTGDEALSADNILEEIAKVYDAIPQSVLDEQFFDPSNKVRIFMGGKAYRFLRQALSTAPTNTNVQLPSFTIDNGVIAYLGVECVYAQGIGDDIMFAAGKQNLVLATNLLEDATLKVEAGKTLVDENKVYVKSQYRIAADYIFSDEVVLYTVDEDGE